MQTETIKFVKERAQQAAASGRTIDQISVLDGGEVVEVNASQIAALVEGKDERKPRLP